MQEQPFPVEVSQNPSNRPTAIEPHPPECVVETEGEVVVVRLLGEHDLNSADALGTTLARASQAGRGLVVDLTETEFIDSSTLAALVRVDKEGDGRLVVQVQTAYAVRRVLEITGLLEFFVTAPTREQAVELALRNADR